MKILIIAHYKDNVRLPSIAGLERMLAFSSRNHSEAERSKSANLKPHIDYTAARSASDQPVITAAHELFEHYSWIQMSEYHNQMTE